MTTAPNQQRRPVARGTTLAGNSIMDSLKQELGDLGQANNADHHKQNILNWFDLETKCQKLTYDVVQPTIKRQEDDRAQMKDIRDELQKDVQKRLQECEFFLFNKTADGKTPTVFDKMNQKIAKIELNNREEIDAVN